MLLRRGRDLQTKSTMQSMPWTSDSRQHCSHSKTSYHGSLFRSSFSGRSGRARRPSACRIHAGQPSAEPVPQRIHSSKGAGGALRRTAPSVASWRSCRQARGGASGHSGLGALRPHPSGCHHRFGSVSWVSRTGLSFLACQRVPALPTRGNGKVLVGVSCPPACKLQCALARGPPSHARTAPLPLL